MLRRIGAAPTGGGEADYEAEQISMTALGRSERGCAVDRNGLILAEEGLFGLCGELESESGKAAASEAALRRQDHDGHGTPFGDRRDQAGQGAIFSLYGYEGLGRFYSGLRVGRDRRLR